MEDPLKEQHGRLAHKFYYHLNLFLPLELEQIRRTLKRSNGFGTARLRPLCGRTLGRRREAILRREGLRVISH